MMDSIRTVIQDRPLNGMVCEYKLDPLKCATAFSDIANKKFNFRCKRMGTCVQCFFQKELLASFYWTEMGFFLLENSGNPILAILITFSATIIDEFKSDEKNDIEFMNFLFNQDVFASTEPPPLIAVDKEEDLDAQLRLRDIDTEEIFESEDENSEDEWI